MTHPLREALQDLADHAGDGTPPPEAPPAEYLWTRGRRARRRRGAASVLASAAVVAVLGAVLPVVGEEVSQAPGPTSYEEGDLAVPDHIWAPSSWAPTAGEDAPPGPLALVAAAERRSPWLFTASEQWYGVSAVDQSYHWLELPDHGAGDIALSPDGRRIGYFLAGDPPGEGAQSETVGYAVYDTETGEVTRHLVSTRRGLAGRGLVWSPDSRRLVASYGQYMRQSGFSTLGVAESWEPGTDTVVRLEVGQSGDVSGVAPDGVTASSSDGGLLVADPRSGAVRSLSISPRDRSSIGEELIPDNIHVNGSGTAIALRGNLPTGPGSATSGLHAGRLSAEGRITDMRLLGERWQLNRILGWTDDQHVLAEAHPRGGYGLRYVTYDLRSGEVNVVIRHTDPPDRWLQASFARDLLLRPLTQGTAPATPWHPWWGVMVAVGVAATVLAVAAVGRARSRRVGLVPRAGRDA